MEINWNKYIETNPKIMFGKPVIIGTRIPVDLILEKLSLGETTEQLLKSYPWSCNLIMKIVADESDDYGIIDALRKMVMKF